MFVNFSSSLSKFSPGKGPIVVALSGGVDSAVCAGLLVEAGHQVVGMSMRLYNAKDTAASRGGRCCGPRDLEDARLICAHLGIPFYVANYEELFQKAVIDDFIEKYTSGKTPNPCVRCNERVKFLPLLHRAISLDASALCTGHYAQIEFDKNTKSHRLLRGIDHNKDQSYFLFSMPKEALPFVKFPLGGMTKVQVREHAKRLGLPNAEKPESQEICFVPDGNHANFVAKAASLSQSQGEIIASNGQVVGTHDGIQNFTIGQRRGLHVGLGEKQYVVHIDAVKKRIHLGKKEALFKTSFTVEEVKWLVDTQVGESMEALVQIRHRHTPKLAHIEVTGPTTAKVSFNEPEPAVAPGQAAVFYKGNQVLGGGMIELPLFQT